MLGQGTVCMPACACWLVHACLFMHTRVSRTDLEARAAVGVDSAQRYACNFVHLPHVSMCPMCPLLLCPSLVLACCVGNNMVACG